MRMIFQATPEKGEEHKGLEEIAICIFMKSVCHLKKGSEDED